mmetsp:Transcript_25976/g.56931  ORF Transcript_25976/g.56931 Transcript_25976/m.56931 type:complete len:348 (-) Transcript_25976:757-1800(-)
MELCAVAGGAAGVEAIMSSNVDKPASCKDNEAFVGADAGACFSLPLSAGAAADVGGMSASCIPLNMSPGGGGGAPSTESVAICSESKSEGASLADAALARGSTCGVAKDGVLGAIVSVGGASLRSRRFSTGASVGVAGASLGTALGADLGVVTAASPPRPRSSTTLRAFSLSDDCVELSCACTSCGCSWKKLRTTALESLMRPSMTASVLSRRCHSPPSSLACSSAAIAAESSDLHALQNLCRSSLGTLARTPPGAVMSSTRRRSKSPACAACALGAAGGARAAGCGTELRGGSAGAAHPPPGRPGWYDELDPWACEAPPAGAAGGWNELAPPQRPPPKLRPSAPDW